jgi:predicted amidophosphoribosyltransferase
VAIERARALHAPDPRSRTEQHDYEGHRIDHVHRADHCYLELTDCCHFLAEYHPGVGAGRDDGGRFRRLVADFKCRPSVAARHSARMRRKCQAIATLALGLRAALARSLVEAATWVPIPPSCAAGDPDYDDRLAQTLAAAFAGYDLDLRLLLTQPGSMPADHRTPVRISEHRLYERLRVDASALSQRPLRERIVLFDDLLVSGKHYRCCRRRLHELLPQIPVCGWFLARRVLPQRWRGMPPPQRTDYAK